MRGGFQVMGEPKKHVVMITMFHCGVKGGIKRAGTPAEAAETLRHAPSTGMVSTRTRAVPCL